MAMYYCAKCKKFTKEAMFKVGKCSSCKEMYEEDDMSYSISFLNKYKDGYNMDNIEEVFANYKKKRKQLEESVTASEIIPGKEIVEVLGIVNGSWSYNPAGLLGEGLLMTDKNMQVALDFAKRRMIAKADKLEADAVISFAMTTTKMGNDNLVSVTGTAVKVKDAEQATVNANDSTVSGADEIIKYKNLLDSGIITQDEFDAKKKQLLGL